MKVNSIIFSIILFIISLLPLKSILCQDFFYDGYIIGLNNDTLYGKVKDLGLTKNAALCTFIPNGSDEITNYIPGEIFSYYVNSKYYMSKPIKYENIDTLLFVEYLVDGIIDLFNVPFNNMRSYLFEDEEDNQYLVNHRKIDVLKFDEINRESKLMEELRIQSQDLGVLRYVVKDYHPIQSKLDYIDLDDKKSVIKLMVDYHNGVCFDEKCIEYTKKKIKSEVYIGVSAGLNNTIISFSGDDYWRYLSDAKTTKQLSFIYGLDLSVTLPSINERLSLDFVFEKSREDLRYDYNLDFSSITNFSYDFNSYSILFNYVLIQKKINYSPFFGTSLIAINNYKESIQIQTIGIRREPLEVNNMLFSINAGINLDIPLSLKGGVYLRSKLGYKIVLSHYTEYIYLKENYQNFVFGFTLFKRISG